MQARCHLPARDPLFAYLGRFFVTKLSDTVVYASMKPIRKRTRRVGFVNRSVNINLHRCTHCFGNCTFSAFVLCRASGPMPRTGHEVSGGLDAWDVPHLQLLSLRSSVKIEELCRDDVDTGESNIVIQPSAEDFFQDCGTSSPPLLEVEHHERLDRTRQTMALPFAVLGSEERADLRLEDQEVSHRHAYLQVVAGSVWCADLGSRTGTHDQTGAPCPAALLDSRGIRIGPYTIRRVDETTRGENASTAPVNPISSAADDPSLFPRLALEIRGGAARQMVWLVDRPVTLIGRASFCKVRLHSPLVSQAHASLVNTSNGPWVIDLLGRAGIYVNGMSVRWARLEPEDEIQLDQFRIRLRYLAPPTRALLLSSSSQLDPKTSANDLTFGSRLIEPAFSAANSSLRAFVPPTSVQPMNGNESLLFSLFSQFSQMQQQMFDQFQQTLLLMAQTFGNLHREQMALVREELAHIQDLTRQLHALQSESKVPTVPARPSSSEPSAAAKSTAAAPTPTAAKPTAAAPSPTAAPTSSTPRFEGDVHTWLSKRLEAIQQERQSRLQKVLSILTGK